MRKGRYKMRLVITDVTEMHGGNYCVAGWNAQTDRMVRPLPNGANWTASIRLVHAGSIAWLAAGSPPTYAAVNQAFGGHLVHSSVWNGAQQGVHVPENTRVGSLSAVRLTIVSLTLFENDYQGKRSLRAYLDDGYARYNLPVVAKSLREAYRLNGVQAARGLLPAHCNVHVRLGLARAWSGQPGKCSLMINGIYG